MSTLAYAGLTRKRKEAAPNTSISQAAPGLTPYVDTLAALVPTEILAAHATFLAFTTTTVQDSKGQATVTITEPAALEFAFWLLAVLSIVLYVGATAVKSNWDRFDFFRMFIPPLSFVAWTMVQKATAFDAAFPGVNNALRTICAVCGAMMLGALSTFLAYKADEVPTA